MVMSIQQGDRGFVIMCHTGDRTVSVPVSAIHTAFQMNDKNDNIVLVIKLIRDFTGLSLVESRDVVMLYKLARELGTKS